LGKVVAIPFARSMNATQIRVELKKYASKEKARILQRFFKTGPGEYAQGDIFLGVVVPRTRWLAKKYQLCPLREVLKLLHSLVHEERLLALLILMLHFKGTDLSRQRRIYRLYLSNTRFINNWDLVDLTAAHIVGQYLADKSRLPLYTLARSNLLWERRIAIIATHHFIRNHQYADTLRIARILLTDRHELIHKAVGWMLREVGKQDLSTEEAFLRRFCTRMPRTMLRYAIERFPESRRQRFLKMKREKS